MKGRRIAYGRLLACLALLVLLIWGIWFAVRLKKIYSGEIIANIPDPDKYPVMGVDVSRYQGNIDWPVLASQDVSFAFIKATEGSSHVDPCFAENWQGAAGAGVYRGAYHFFSFESSGATQAENFISVVGELDGDLPPVVDLEFYGEYAEDPLSKKETRAILDELLDTLEDHYGTPPIIYTTTRAYYSYILGGGYGRYPLWMRDTYMEPMVRLEFWQYSDEGRLSGYDGVQHDQTENFIDLNVYHGSLEDLQETYALPAKEEDTPT